MILHKEKRKRVIEKEKKEMHYCYLIHLFPERENAVQTKQICHLWQSTVHKWFNRFKSGV